MRSRLLGALLQADAPAELERIEAFYKGMSWSFNPEMLSSVRRNPPSLTYPSRPPTPPASDLSCAALGSAPHLLRIHI